MSMRWWVPVEDGEAADRHPSARRWKRDVGRLRSRIVDELIEEGAPFPEVAAAVLAARARSGSVVEEFDASLSVPPAVVADAEAGHVPLEDLPVVLRRLMVQAIAAEDDPYRS